MYLPNSWDSTHFEAMAPERANAAPRNNSNGGTIINKKLINFCIVLIQHRYSIFIISKQNKYK